MKGIIAVRGTLIAVHDLATRLGSDAGPGEHRKIVIADTGTDRVGIVVDGVAEVLTVDDSAFLPVPIAGDHAVEAMVVVGERLISVLSLDRLLGREPRVP